MPARAVVGPDQVTAVFGFHAFDEHAGVGPARFTMVLDIHRIHCIDRLHIADRDVVRAIAHLNRAPKITRLERDILDQHVTDLQSLVPAGE